MLTEPGLWGFYSLRRLKEAGWTAEQLAAALPHVRVGTRSHSPPRYGIQAGDRAGAATGACISPSCKRENTMWTPSEQREIDRQVRNALERLWRTPARPCWKSPPWLPNGPLSCTTS